MWLTHIVLDWWPGQFATQLQNPMTVSGWVCLRKNMAMQIYIDFTVVIERKTN